jgi:hypothetical protein
MIKKLLLISAMLAGSGLVTANATPVLSFTPSSQSVTLGSQASVDVVLSGLEEVGLNEILSAYDVSFTYDDSILGYAGGTFYDLVGISPAAIISGGVISWNSTSFASDASLQSSQGDSLTLATVVFNTLSPGTSALSFSLDGHDLSGLTDPSTGFPEALAHDISSGSITVTSQNGSVPEPPTMMLMGLGALVMAGVKRRKTRLDAV